MEVAIEVQASVDEVDANVVTYLDARRVVACKRTDCAVEHDV